MRWPSRTSSPMETALTLGLGAMGALLAWLAQAPIYILLGPALAVTLAGIAGMRTSIDPGLRNTCFVLLGTAVGAGFDQDALGAMLRWPLAFVFMALVIWVIMVACRAVLQRYFGFDARSALLASAPGHLSFVMAIAAETQSDLARISVTQSVRLLALTLLVPFAALAMGVDLSGRMVLPGAAMALVPMIGVIVLGVGLGWIFGKLNVPAPLLLGPMVVSALAHLTGVVTGTLPAWLLLPAYLVLGSLIGTRFSGVPLARFVSGLGAGVAITVIAVVMAGLGALPVAWALGMPLAHVLVAFAPGGLETMIAIGVVLGVIPGFVAACHIARLLVLSVYLPMMLARLNP